MNKQLITTGVANAGHRRRRKDHDKGFRNLGANACVHLCQNRGHSLFARVSLRKFLERQKDSGRIRLIAAEEIESRELDRVEYAGCLVRDLRDLVDDCLGAIERSRIG